ncbi:MAG: flagellar hook assembly protein FlgD [Deltaproteobacteria bacterium]|nr:flagellar hook assembly protein FlgD [Deltaproteobacteria bacterium]
MSVSSVDLLNQTAGMGKAPVNNGTKMGKDEFLKLLLTQLKAQDPLNPTDSSEFVAQLSQFSSLEQLTNLGTKMDNLVTISGASNAANSVSLLGKDIRADGNKLKGPTSVFYELDKNAKSVKLEIRKLDGTVVRTIENLDTKSGLQEVKITDLPAGDYTFRVEAKDLEGAEMKPALSVADRVKGVSFSGNVPVLLMESGNEIPASQLIEIREPAKVAG